MREEIEAPKRFNRCYGCGSANDRGLGLRFFRDGETVVADFVPAPEHGGFGKILHGGVTATLVDEAFGWTMWGILKKLGMTTELTMKYSAPLTTGEKCTVVGRVESTDAREAHLRAEVLDAGGHVAAVGTGTFRFISARVVERLGGFEVGSIAGD